ncbi:hypothetical protein BJ508DRAFT_332062 [Ascobolus immersus RN42]|uniref:Uncharacterized protein n=1 Tax=Ascobolus immersus RN42 TaxID=1160509 RepID=A0A3N4HNY7_ASCIM|nr:hypothetical protein BJ508DRAFT_332062 [Ascobolus immersus RN42]
MEVNVATCSPVPYVNTRNQEPGNRQENNQVDTGNWLRGTRNTNQEPGTRNQEIERKSTKSTPETGSVYPPSQHQEPGTRNQEPGTRNQEPGNREEINQVDTGNRLSISTKSTPGTKNQEPGTRK